MAVLRSSTRARKFSLLFILSILFVSRKMDASWILLITHSLRVVKRHTDVQRNYINRYLSGKTPETS